MPGKMRRAQAGGSQLPRPHLEGSKVGGLVSVMVAEERAQCAGPAGLHSQQAAAWALDLVTLH